MSYSESFGLLNRKNTDSVKWDIKGMKYMAKYVDDESLPLWVADMDFKTVPSALKKLIERIEHGCFGYSIPDNSYYESLVNWYSKHYHWNIKPEWVVTSPGVVPALAHIVRTFTEEGDKIIIQEPVYYPFREMIIEKNNRIVANNELIEKNGEYSIDFEDLKKQAADPKTKLMILCSPHNPIGKLWSKEELNKIAQICYENNVLLCSDEVHSDLVLFGHKFTTCGLLEEKYLQNLIVCTAPSKTFNLAAFATSNLIIPNETIKAQLVDFMEKLVISTTPSFLGNILLPAVYSADGEKWLSELLKILEENFNFVKNYLQENLPKVKLVSHEATYLIWVDFRDTGLSWEDIERKMEEEAKVVLDYGSKFGKAGQGFMRINIACHQSTLQMTLERMMRVYR